MDKLLTEITATLEAWQDEGKDYVACHSFNGVAFEILAKIREVVEGLPLANHSRRKFKPNHKGFSSCIECEKNMAKAELQAILKAFEGDAS